MKPTVLRQLCELKELTTYHYKVILFLMSCNEANQTQIAKVLEVPKQNINRVFKDLSSMDIVIHSRKEGNSIFWKLNTNPKFQAIGQLKLDI